jgi:hypothetical protein
MKGDYGTYKLWEVADNSIDLCSSNVANGGISLQFGQGPREVKNTNCSRSTYNNYGAFLWDDVSTAATVVLPIISRFLTTISCNAPVGMHINYLYVERHEFCIMVHNSFSSACYELSGKLYLSHCLFGANSGGGGLFMKLENATAANFIVFQCQFGVGIDFPNTGNEIVLGYDLVDVQSIITITLRLARSKSCQVLYIARTEGFSPSISWSVSESFIGSIGFPVSDDLWETDSVIQTDTMSQSENSSSSAKFAETESLSQSKQLSETANVVSSLNFPLTNFIESEGLLKTPLLSLTKELVKTVHFISTANFLPTLTYSVSSSFSMTNRYSRSAVITQTNGLDSSDSNFGATSVIQFTNIYSRSSVFSSVSELSEALDMSPILEKSTESFALLSSTASQNSRTDTHSESNIIKKLTTTTTTTTVTPAIDQSTASALVIQAQTSKRIVNESYTSLQVGESEIGAKSGEEEEDWSLLIVSIVVMVLFVVCFAFLMYKEREKNGIAKKRKEMAGAEPKTKVRQFS